MRTVVVSSEDDGFDAGEDGADDGEGISLSLASAMSQLLF